MSSSFFEIHHSEPDVAALSEYAVPDTACRRTLIGEAVLKDLEDKLSDRGLRVVRRVEQTHNVGSVCAGQGIPAVDSHPCGPQKSGVEMKRLRLYIGYMDTSKKERLMRERPRGSTQQMPIATEPK